MHLYDGTVVDFSYICTKRFYMVVSIRLKNFYSIHNEVALDFTAESSGAKKDGLLSENIIKVGEDKFVNIIGLFGSNAAGKSNLIKAVDFCRQLILYSQFDNEGEPFGYQPFKFSEDKESEFHIDFIWEGIEYEYGFVLSGGKVESEYLNYFPNRRRAKVFCRERTHFYSYGKGVIPRPTEIEANTSSRTLFLSRASLMNREIPRTVYRYFLTKFLVGIGDFNFSNFDPTFFYKHKELVLKALEISDSDIIDLQVSQPGSGRPLIMSFHKENPAIAFDFLSEESEGTKRLLSILLFLLESSMEGATLFLDEFDLKLHLRLAEFILDVIRASKGGQFVFTSHNSSLINRNSLRDEQIVFVNKLPDGSSEFTPLSDFDGVGKNTDIQKAYLAGLFDAVPFTGSYESILRILGK